VGHTSSHKHTHTHTHKHNLSLFVSHMQVLREGDWQEHVTSALVRLGSRLLDTSVLPFNPTEHISTRASMLDTSLPTTASASAPHAIAKSEAAPLPSSPALAAVLQHVVQPPSLQVKMLVFAY